MKRPILFIIPAIITGGAEIHAMIRLREMSRCGIPVRLMVLSKAIDPEVLADAELIEEHLCRLRNPSSTLDLPFLKMSWRDLSRAAAFARRHDVGSHFFARLLFLAMLLRGRLVRLVQYHHSLEHKLNARDTVAKRVFFAANQLLARICDHAHWHVSEQVREDVSRGFTRRNAIIHNSCDMDSPGDPGAAERLLAPARKRGSPYVMLVPGRLMWMKGHVLFLHALARVCQAVEIEPAQLQVFFVGEGAQRRAIEATIDELGLGQCVTLTGKVAHPVLLALYHMVDLVVVPSLDEGFGNVAIEALSRRALVLASDAGGLREILRHGENGFVFAAGDEDALVAELEVIWHDRHNALIDRDAARRDCVARFGLDAHVDRVVALLRG
jgi:glycosyltransferase involved in cell wall biosynthesis